MEKILGIIVARGGSQRLPDKNLLLLNGHPLIGIAVDSLVTSGVCDRVVVITDSEIIAKAAKCYGADIPFMEPVDMATDMSHGNEVVRWAVEQLGGYKYVLQTQATCPLTLPVDFANARDMLIEKDAEFVISVTSLDPTCEGNFAIPSNGCIKNLLHSYSGTDFSQKAEPRYYVNGAIYLQTRGNILNEKPWTEQDIYAYPMPQERSIDIDSEIDYALTMLINKRKSDIKQLVKERKNG